MHSVRHKTALLNRIRKIGGQVNAIERAIDSEKDRDAILHLIAAVRGATDALMAEMVDEQIRFHVLAPAKQPPQERLKGADPVIQVIRAYLK